MGKSLSSEASLEDGSEEKIFGELGEIPRSGRGLDHVESVGLCEPKPKGISNEIGS